MEFQWLIYRSPLMIAIDKDFYIGVCALLNAKADIFDEDNILPQKFHNIFSDFIYGIFFLIFLFIGHHFIMQLKLVIQKLFQCCSISKQTLIMQMFFFIFSWISFNFHFFYEISTFFLMEQLHCILQVIELIQKLFLC